MSQLGRISGPLLTDDLLRNGIDLAFDTDLLYLKVGPAVLGSPGGGPGEDGDPNPTAGDRSIGINTDSPTDYLTVNNDIRVSQDLIITGPTATIDNIIINSNSSFTTVSGGINIIPTGADAFIQYGDILTTDFRIKDNFIHITSGIDTDLRLDASGTGYVDLLNNTQIAGNLQVDQNISSTGDVRLNGQFIIGDSPIDTVTVQTDFTQSLIPGVNDTYDLGSPSRRWDQIWFAGDPVIQNANVLQIVIDNQISFSGNTITSVVSNQDVELLPDTGITRIERITIQDNLITSLDPTPLTISHAGNGYLNFNYNTAFVIPVGNSAERQDNEVGETRWNTDLQYLECFDGNVWQVATGGGVVVTEEVMQNLVYEYTLVFG